MKVRLVVRAKQHNHSFSPGKKKEKKTRRTSEEEEEASEAQSQECRHFALCLISWEMF